MHRGIVPGLVKIGRLGRKHGFNGQLILHVDANQPENIIQEKEFLFVEFDGKGVPFFVNIWDDTSGILTLDAVSSEAAAAGLEGREVLMPLAEGSEEESDFTGYEVHDLHAGLLGSFLRTEEFPGQLMLVVWTDQGEVLIPEGLVCEVQEDLRRIMTDLPDGYLEALR
jgi:16S rRNA processing protein RimM